MKTILRTAPTQPACIHACKAVRACSASDYSAERSKKFEMRSGGLYFKLVLPEKAISMLYCMMV